MTDAREQQSSTVTERLASIIGYHLASTVSGNNMPDMSGDPRKRIPEVRRRIFDRACQSAAEAIASEFGIPAQQQPNRREEIAGIFHDYLARATGETLILLQDILHDVDDVLSAVPPAQQTQWQPIETGPRDGSIVLICGRSHIGKYFVADSKWNDGWMLFHPENDDYTERCFLPTHWQPLPAPPDSPAFASTERNQFADSTGEKTGHAGASKEAGAVTDRVSVAPVSSNSPESSR